MSGPNAPLQRGVAAYAKLLPTTSPTNHGKKHKVTTAGYNTAPPVGPGPLQTGPVALVYNQEPPVILGTLQRRAPCQEYLLASRLISFAPPPPACAPQLPVKIQPHSKCLCSTFLINDI